MMVRHMCGVTLRDMKSSEELRQMLRIESVTEVVRKDRLRWFAHVERKDDNDWVKACQRFEAAGKRGRGGGRKTWRECLVGDMKDLGLQERDVQDRVVWKGLIRGNHLIRASTD